MAVKRSIFVVAFLLTLFLLVSILLLGNVLNDKRVEFIDRETQRTYNSLSEMQTFQLMSDTYGSEMACLAFSNKLVELDTSLWNLGLKLDQYRVASEEFSKSKYYQEQKQIFNENEVMYLLLLRKMRAACDYNQTLILFFYQNSETCKKCDDQSFVLTDINKEIDDDISIFSFDMDLNITSIKLLSQYYKIDTYPCTVVDDTVLCGIQDKETIMQTICEQQPDIPACKQYLPALL